MIPYFYIGTSVAISWAWGTSLILGMQIAQQKGLEAFLIWATANCLTLLLFGFLYKKEILNKAVLERPVVKIFANLIQLFSLIIQLKILRESLETFLPSFQAGLITFLFSAGLFIWMYRKGLKASIMTDVFQGLGTLLILVLMAVICYSELNPAPIASSNTSNVTWALWSACILLSGIMTDIQHWQRAEANGKRYAFEVATVFFACYMALVFFLSKYQFNDVLNLLLLLAVVGVTTSTIDSIAVALHKDFGRNKGTLVGLLICLGYPLLVELSVLNLWSYFGTIRVGLALYILYWCISNKHAIKLRSSSSITGTLR